MSEITELYIKGLIGPRPADSHKGNNGRVLIIAGSTGMAGAAVMAARAALRSGAGLVTVSIPKYLFPILQTAVPEAMCIDREEIMTRSLGRFDAVAIGPGLGKGKEQYQMVEHLLLSYSGPVIIDADGINSLCAFGKVPAQLTISDVEQGITRRMVSILPDMISRRKRPVILTPHPGEADRLLKSLGQQRVSELGREAAAETLARQTGAIIALKGAGTLVSAPAAKDTESTDADAPDVETWINTTGNPGMATGGSGDVLTGVIAALTAYSRAGRKNMVELTTADAVRAAVYIHGLAGDIAAREIGEIGMTAMDIADALPAAFQRIAGR